MAKIGHGRFMHVRTDFLEIPLKCVASIFRQASLCVIIHPESLANIIGYFFQLALAGVVSPTLHGPQLQLVISQCNRWCFSHIGRPVRRLMCRVEKNNGKTSGTDRARLTHYFS